MEMINLKKAGWKRIEKSRKTLIDGKQKKLTILERVKFKQCKKNKLF